MPGVGVANIGIRPTVEHRGVLCEVHLFDRYRPLLKTTSRAFERIFEART